MSMFEISGSSSDLAIAANAQSARSESRVDAHPAEADARVTSVASKVTQESLQVATRLKVLLGSAGSVVAVTGLNSADGSAGVAAKLAASMAAIDRTSRVLLVDANDDRPTDHKQPGLMNLLEDSSSIEQVLHQEELENLFTLAIGESSQSMAALLSSARSNIVFQQLREKHRYMVIDAGVVRSGPSGMLLAALSDGVIAGLTAGAHNQQEVRDFQQELRRLSIPLLGFVLIQNK